MESWRVYWCENIRSSGGVVYEESEDAGEGNSWRGEVWGGCSSAGFCSGEAELEAARRSCYPISILSRVVPCMTEARTYKVFEPLLELLAVVALGNAVLYPPALSKVGDLGPVLVGIC